MKFLLYLVAALIFTIWAILIIGFNTSSNVHLLLGVAVIIVIFNMLFGKKLFKK